MQLWQDFCFASTVFQNQLNHLVHYFPFSRDFHFYYRPPYFPSSTGIGHTMNVDGIHFWLLLSQFFFVRFFCVSLSYLFLLLAPNSHSSIKTFVGFFRVVLDASSTVAPRWTLREAINLIIYHPFSTRFISFFSLSIIPNRRKWMRSIIITIITTTCRKVSHPLFLFPSRSSEPYKCLREVLLFQPFHAFAIIEISNFNFPILRFFHTCVTPIMHRSHDWRRPAAGSSRNAIGSDEPNLRGPRGIQ